MPTYEYVCDNCGNKFETFQSIKADPLKHCDVCGKDALRRLISAGGGLIFKGSGFYLTDYKNKSAETKTPASKPKETKPAETKTESKSESPTSTPSSGKSNSASSTESKPSSNKKK